MLANKEFLKNYSRTQLEVELKKLSQPAYRASQIFEYLYKKRATGFDSMKNLPAELQLRLDEIFAINTFTNYKYQQSSDGTIKYLFELSDGKAIESVLISTSEENDKLRKKRITLCLSTQVGCALNCAFCATGKIGFKRNLQTSEIVDQFLKVESLSGEKITNVVFMGMGEPLLNYENVVNSIKIFTDKKGLGLSPKRITVSTVGIADIIKRLADEDLGVKLAVSLHSTNNGVREKLIPIAKKWNLKSLGEAIEYYYQKTKIPITYEYILFDGLNDSEQDAVRLAKFTRRVPSKINIIPYHNIKFTNPTGFANELYAADMNKIKQFVVLLRSLGIAAFIRTSSGEDIDAACGQLAFSGEVIYKLN